MYGRFNRGEEENVSPAFRSAQGNGLCICPLAQAMPASVLCMWSISTVSIPWSDRLLLALVSAGYPTLQTTSPSPASGSPSLQSPVGPHIPEYYPKQRDEGQRYTDLEPSHQGRI